LSPSQTWLIVSKIARGDLELLDIPAPGDDGGNRMSTLRTFGIVLGAFIISLPVMYLMNHGLPAKWTLPVASTEEAEEDKDDPVVDVLCLKGLMLLADQKYEQAIAAYSDAIRRDPKYSFAYLGRGDVYLAKGDLDRAGLDYNSAVRLDPTNEEAKARAHAVAEQRMRR
jgi:tetratricopeptide (TPR) repeat protein